LHTMKKRFINRSSSICLAVLTLAGLATLSGCGANYHVTRAISNNRPARDLKAPVEIIHRGTHPERPFQVLGKIFVEKSYSLWNAGDRDVDIIERLKVAARKLGAEAIIDAHVYAARGNYSSDTKRWAGGLAVTFADTAVQQAATDFVVIIPTLAGASFGQQEAIREYLQYDLQKKGFYAMLSKDSLTEANISQLSEIDLKTSGQQLASYVMMVEYRLPTLGMRDHNVKAVLVSADKRSAVWQNAVDLSIGDETPPVEENVIHAPNIATLKRAIKNLILPLPDYSAFRN